MRPDSKRVHNSGDEIVDAFLGLIACNGRETARRCEDDATIPAQQVIGAHIARRSLALLP